MLNRIDDRDSLKIFISFINKLSKYKFDKDHSVINDFFDKIVIDIDERYNLDNYYKRQKRESLSLWTRDGAYGGDQYPDGQQADMGRHGEPSSMVVSQDGSHSNSQIHYQNVNGHWQNPTEIDSAERIHQNQVESHRSADMLPKRP